MGRHSAPEGRHRRHGALFAQVGLVSVISLVALAVLFGSGVMRERTVSGALAGSQAGEQASSATEMLGTTEPGEPSSAAVLPTTATTTTTVTKTATATVDSDASPTSAPPARRTVTATKTATETTTTTTEPVPLPRCVPADG